MSLFYRYEGKMDIKDPPIEGDDLVCKKCTDTKLSKSGRMMSGDLDMNLYKLKTCLWLSIIQTQFQDYI